MRRKATTNKRVRRIRTTERRPDQLRHDPLIPADHSFIELCLDVREAHIAEQLALCDADLYDYDSDELSEARRFKRDTFRRLVAHLTDSND